MQKVKKTMVIKLFNAALQLASYRKSKTHYKRHTVFAHARKTGYNPRYSCWTLYAPYANEPKYKQNYKKKTPPLVSVPPSRAGNCNSISLCINSTAIYSMSCLYPLYNKFPKMHYLLQIHQKSECY